MPLKIKGNGLPNGSEDNLIKKIIFNDPYQNISNADLRKLKYGSDAAWARAYTVDPFDGDTDAIDADTISMQVTATDTVTGTSARYIVEENAIKNELSEAEKLVYDGDTVSFSASAAKGYSAPTVSNDITVSSDINLDDYISPGSTLGIEAPDVTNDPTYDVYFTNDSVSVTVYNENNFTVSLQYYTSSTSTGSGTYETVGDITANNQTTFDIPGNVINAESSTPNKYIHLKFVYGAAVSTSVYELGRVDSTPHNTFSPSQASVKVGEMVSVTCNLEWGDVETIYLSASPGGIISYPTDVSGEQFTLVITGVSAGTTTLTATCYMSNGSDVSLASSASCTITVIDDQPEQQAGSDYVILDKDSISLNGIEDSATLVASTGGPSTNVDWSFPSFIRAIPAGTNTYSIMGKSNGFGTITVTRGSASASCIVAVLGIDSGSGDDSGSSSGGCVLFNTPILIDEDKYEIIENLHVGDVIMGYNNDHKLVKTKIINKYRAVVSDIYKIILNNSTELFVTGNHPIMRMSDYANIDGVLSYEKLNIGDTVITTNGTSQVVDIKKINKKSLVYNLYTELDNFIANDIVVACENPDTLIIGENCFEICEGWSGSTITKDHGVGGCVSSDTRIAVPNNGYTLAKDLHKGDTILCYDNNMNLVETVILNTYYADNVSLYEIIFDDNSSLYVTDNHPILCENEYCNITGVLGYSKLELGQNVISTRGALKIVDIVKINSKERVYNIYTELDNFIANDIVVACENPDTLIVGVNCFETPEGMAKIAAP